ncbi:MAG: hypothetical protein CL878_14195 [Dehalococcoidia bacterium]|nr:hypothetical protein [Dehalococcoidia bacterium]
MTLQQATVIIVQDYTRALAARHAGAVQAAPPPLTRDVGRHIEIVRVLECACPDKETKAS